MYTVIPTEQFEKDVKYYIKKKGFIHIGSDIKIVTDELKKGNLIRTEIPGLKIPTDGHTFKVRSANTDTGAGRDLLHVEWKRRAVRYGLEAVLTSFFWYKINRKLVCMITDCTFDCDGQGGQLL